MTRWHPLWLYEYQIHHPLTHKSHVISPQVPINPKEKSFQRFLKRHSAKVEVFQKGGFLRSDTLIGTAKVELAPLEGKCTVHDRFVFMSVRLRESQLFGCVHATFARKLWA